MSPASEPNSLGSGVRTHFSWIRHHDLRFLDLRFLNIIICVINFIIIKIIYIIINIINKISNKFEKNIISIEKQSQI